MNEEIRLREIEAEDLQSQLNKLRKKKNSNSSADQKEQNTLNEQINEKLKERKKLMDAKDEKIPIGEKM